MEGSRQCILPAEVIPESFVCNGSDQMHLFLKIVQTGSTLLFSETRLNYFFLQIAYLKERRIMRIIGDGV